IVVRSCEIGFEPQHFGILCDRLSDFPLIIEYRPKTVMSICMVWVDTDSGPVAFGGFGKLSCGCQSVSEIIVSIRELGINPNRLPIVRYGLVAVTLISERSAKIIVCARITARDGQRMCPQRDAVLPVPH